MRDKEKSQGLIEIFMYKHHLIWEAYNKEAQEEFLKKLEQLILKQGYIHKDDPITAKFKCDKCSGTGQIKRPEKDCHPTDTVFEPCPNPHCHDGMVEETLVHKYDFQRHGCKSNCGHKEQCECESGSFTFKGCKIITPITFATYPDDPKTAEWRVINTNPDA